MLFLLMNVRCVVCVIHICVIVLMFFLLTIIGGWLIVLLYVWLDVRVFGWLDRVLQSSRFAIHLQVCELLLLLLALVRWYLLYAILSSICLLVRVSRSSICLSWWVSQSVVSLINLLPGLAVPLVLNSFVRSVSIRLFGVSMRTAAISSLGWSIIWLEKIHVARTPGCL